MNSDNFKMYQNSGYNNPRNRKRTLILDVDDSTEEWVPRRLAGTTAFTYIDYESAVTEQNRNLKIIKPHNIKEVARKFINEMGA